MTDPTKSSIYRCEHGVYFPDKPTHLKNHACSICTPILIGEKAKTVLIRDEKGRWQNIRSTGV
jgi:hypothetical protein